ncbi:hypothetical protein [Spongiactinospora sp. TRM90649]|uniref:hypothetical protein n=1 Tax=Spongiactinospora sp. TRM90649 TaxID=3031114 RepID=UPI0023F9E1A6|nr:hypothetical protein [Spongiactinospora sp. TRM90649]MDF5752925.1 hypothetical protein [Spongiactinospora sp. TRM90649]
MIDPADFARWIGMPLLAFWRRVWVYRRHWQPAMMISGLGRHLRGRDYLPHLLRVACTSWSDQVTVKMLTGQAVKDWADRAEHLAHAESDKGLKLRITAVLKEMGLTGLHFHDLRHTGNTLGRTVWGEPGRSQGADGTRQRSGRAHLPARDQGRRSADRGCSQHASRGGQAEEAPGWLMAR